MLKILVLEHPDVVPVIGPYLKDLTKETGLAFHAIYAADVPSTRRHLCEADMVILDLAGKTEEQLLAEIIVSNIPVIATTIKPIHMLFIDCPTLRFIKKPEFDLGKLRTAICDFAAIVATRKKAARKQALFRSHLAGQNPALN